MSCLDYVKVDGEIGKLMRKNMMEQFLFKECTLKGLKMKLEVIF